MASDDDVDMNLFSLYQGFYFDEHLQHRCLCLSPSRWPLAAWPLKSPTLPSSFYPCIVYWYGRNNFLPLDFPIEFFLRRRIVSAGINIYPLWIRHAFFIGFSLRVKVYDFWNWGNMFAMILILLLDFDDRINMMIIFTTHI